MAVGMAVLPTVTQLTVPQSHAAQKSFAWRGVGSHSRCLNLHLSDRVRCFLEIGLQRRSPYRHTLADLGVSSTSGELMVTLLVGGWGAFTMTASYTACPKAPVDGIPNVLHYSFWLCDVVTRTRLWRTWIPCTFRRHSTCKECILTGLAVSWLKHNQKNKVRNFVSVKYFSPYTEVCAVSSSMGLLVCCLQVDGLSDEEIQARFTCHTESLPWQRENGLEAGASLCHLHDIWNPTLSSILS